VVEDGAPVAAAAMTPPWNVIVADSLSEALDSLAATIAAAGVELPGVVGNEPTSGRFCEVWSRLTGAEAEKRMAQGVFALDQVSPLSPVEGVPRRAEEGDRSLLEAWVAAFAEEAGGEPANLDEVRRSVANRITARPEQAGLWLWEVGSEPVSLTGHGGLTPNGIRIGPVYTPPEFRGRGYATALVAEQSQWLLEQGRRFCFLYTDLANPTSNAIYRRIGYRQVAESSEYRFS
jgi:predicted GNAT family acetyltransferase